MAVLSLTDLIAFITPRIFQNSQKLITGSNTQQALLNIAESSFNKLSDAALVGLKTYNPPTPYLTGQGTIYNGAIYQANKSTTGAFNVADWDLVASKVTKTLYAPVSFIGNVLTIDVTEFKMVSVVYNGIQFTSGVTYDSSTTPTKLYIDLGEPPTSNVTVIYL